MTYHLVAINPVKSFASIRSYKKFFATNQLDRKSYYKKFSVPKQSIHLTAHKSNPAKKSKQKLFEMSTTNLLRN